MAKKDILVLADLGIAHFGKSFLTKKNDLLANRGYSAPEQKIKGLSKDITSAADIFSLGMIINEIFTGKKPEGFNFTLISDKYPWLIDIDKLLGRCMRHNPAERPTIKEISIEIKLIYNDLKYKKTLIRLNLEDDFEQIGDNNCNNKIKDKIIEQAVNDILTGKYFFENKTAQELKEYNHNYNCNIHYKIDSGLRSAYMEYLIKERCKRTFLYESNVYKQGKNYEPLNLNNNSKDRDIYEAFSSFLKKNSIYNGEILKLFSSCCNYHCEEIIESLDMIQKKVTELDDAPVLYIVKQILCIKDTLDNTYFENEILINWEKSLYSYGYENHTYMSLKNNNHYYEAEEKKILTEFQINYNPVITKNDKGYIIRFEDKKIFNSFKNYALELSKPYYIFEGDVLDLIRIEKEYKGIIELKPWGSFEVTNVLAKIMGFRKDY